MKLQGKSVGVFIQCHNLHNKFVKIGQREENFKTKTNTNTAVSDTYFIGRNVARGCTEETKVFQL